MSDEKILKKAIEKANKCTGALHDIDMDMTEKGFITPSDYFWVIFNLDFAKAFWGEEWINVDIALYADRIDYAGKTISSQPNKYIIDLHTVAWQFYLQQMVISEDPIKYLEKFLN